VSNESYRNVALGLGGMLAVLVIATAVVLLTRGGPTPVASPSVSPIAGSLEPSPSVVPTDSPSVSPTASPTESPSPSVTPSPSPSPSPTPTATASPSPSATASPSPSPTASPSPSATPTDAPTPTASPSPSPSVAPVAEVRFVGIGVDGPAADPPIARLFGFESEGPGEVRAAVSNVSAGEIELCLWIGDRDAVQDLECETMSEGSLSRATSATGPVRWTVSISGADGSAASADVALRFNSTAPAILLRNFRFQGTFAPEYNGFTAIVNARTPGPLTLEAEWPDGADGEYPFRVTLAEVDGETVDEQSGTAASLQYGQFVEAGRYRLRLVNETEIAEREVFLRGTLAWP
jgi:hypothetical protein